MQVRKIVQSPVYQGQDEEIAYKVDVTNWIEIPGSVVLNPTATLKDQNGVDVTATKLSGVCSVSGNNVISPLVVDLEPPMKYRLLFTFEISGNTFSAFMEIQSEE